MNVHDQNDPFDYVLYLARFHDTNYNKRGVVIWKKTKFKTLVILVEKNKMSFFLHNAKKGNRNSPNFLFSINNYTNFLTSKYKLFKDLRKENQEKITNFFEGKIIENS